MEEKHSINQRCATAGVCARLAGLLVLLLSALSVSVQTYAEGRAAYQSYEAGRAAYMSGDYERAFAIFEPLAKAGDSEAQKMVGIMYDYGHGVPADPEKALQWYIRSARQGQSAVQYQVGARYFRGDGVERDHEEAARWWEMAAAGGQADAQFNLGLLYSRGLSVAQDDARAAELFDQAAQQGHGQAQYSLAVMYAFGRGVEKDNVRALEWFKKSAAQGIAQAQFNLGVFYENGYDVEKDAAQARQWYEKAAAQGLSEAKDRLAQLARAASSTAKAPAEQTGADSQHADLQTGSTEQTPAEQTINSADYRVDEITSTGIRREGWVLQQPSNTYTLQIGSISNEQELIKFIQRNQIEADAAYIAIVIDGETRYNAFYGSYEDYDVAQKAIETLPPSLRRVAPWVRNFGVLKKLLEK